MSDKNWSELHSGAEVTGIIKYWVHFSKYLAKPFIWLRISPNQISILAIFISAPFIFYPSAWWLVILGLILDGIDGRVAIERNKVSKFGAVLDSISDRVIEAIWALGLYMLGLNLVLILLFVGTGWIQEYLRARAGGLGYRKIGIVTICERPTRAIFIALISLLTLWSTLILLVALAVQIIALTTLILVFEREINQ